MQGRGEEGISPGATTLWALVGSLGRMEAPADLGSSFFQICLGLKSEGLDRLLNHKGSYEENKQRLETHSQVGLG